MLSKNDEHTIREFAFGYKRNAWLNLFDRQFQMYARCGFHIFDRTKYNTFDIANVLILQPEDRGCGWLTEILEYVEPQFNIYVESIQQPRLVPYLKQRGYRFDSDEYNAIKIVNPDMKWDKEKQ